MKLALCGCLDDTTVGSMEIADYLLHILNERNMQEMYLELCGMPKDKIENNDKCYDIELLMASYANKLGIYCRGKNEKELDVHSACEKFVKLYRKGELDKHILDDLSDYI